MSPTSGAITPLLLLRKFCKPYGYIKHTFIFLVALLYILQGGGDVSHLKRCPEVIHSARWRSLFLCEVDIGQVA